METYIALLRGINVGGKNILPMKDLAGLLEGLGLSKVSTYLASGNVVFQSETADPAGLAEEIGAAIGDTYGFTPQILIRSVEEFRRAAAANPYPEAESEPKSLHLFFLESPPADPDLARLEAVKKASERFKLDESVFYLHAPEGIGRSKLAAGAEKALGVPATGRNWRTVSKVLVRAADVEAGSG
jgi:uncharacterized protein (DUF1697 family)